MESDLKIEAALQIHLDVTGSLRVRVYFCGYWCVEEWTNYWVEASWTRDLKVFGIWGKVLVDHTVHCQEGAN